MLRLVANHLAVRPSILARPPFRQPEMGPQMRDSLALHYGRHHFFDSSSFIVAMSSSCSDKSRFSFAFSLAIVLGPMANIGSIQRLQPLGLGNSHPRILRLPR